MSYLPGSTVSSAGSSNEDSDIDSFFDTRTHGPPVVGPKGSECSGNNDATTVMVAAAAAMVSLAAAGSEAATAAPEDATAPSSLLTPSAAQEDATAASNNAKKAVLKAELQKRLAEIKRLTESQKTPVPHYQAGEVMCFMLPKPDGLPTVLVNVYGKLAHDDVFA